MCDFLSTLILQFATLLAAISAVRGTRRSQLPPLRPFCCEFCARSPISASRSTLVMPASVAFSRIQRRWQVRRDGRRLSCVFGISTVQSASSSESMSVPRPPCPAWSALFATAWSAGARLGFSLFNQQEGIAVHGLRIIRQHLDEILIVSDRGKDIDRHGFWGWPRSQGMLAGFPHPWPRVEWPTNKFGSAQFAGPGHPRYGLASKSAS